MAFQLTISSGKETGKSFLFEQPSVVIGRTAECDVCLFDPGVSRQHARIFLEKDGYFVEDMGSSNGTRVNGNQVKKLKLSNGDALTLGTVVFAFESKGDQKPKVSEHTRIVELDPNRTRPKAKVSLLANGASEEQMNQMARSMTTSMPSIRRQSQSAVAAASRAPSPPPERPSRSTGPRELTAAERARIKRQSSGAGAAAKLFWAGASEGTRKAVYAAAGVVCVAAIALVGWLVLRSPTDSGPRKPEPSVLSKSPIVDSFGLGQGVTFAEPDKKVFTFSYNAPVKAVVILHFQSKDISSNEVQVFVNAAAVDLVPPDTLDVDEHQNEIIIPPDLLKKGAQNTIIFDNLHNPPGEDTWRIWNIRVEVFYIPVLPKSQLLQSANQAFQRGLAFFQRKDIGAENAYDAWEQFREAWLMLEGYPNPKPELYALAKQRMDATQKVLDNQCSQLLLQVESDYNQKNYDAARSDLDHVKSFFPGTKQPCPIRADNKRYELGL